MDPSDASPPDVPAFAALRARLAVVEKERDDAIALVDHDRRQHARHYGTGRLARAAYDARHNLTNSYLALNGAVETVAALDAQGADTAPGRVAQVVECFDPAWVERQRSRLHDRADETAAALLALLSDLAARHGLAPTALQDDSGVSP